MTTLSATPTMLHSIDASGRITEVSDLWLEKLGYTIDEVIGRRSIEFLSEDSARYAREVVLPLFFKTGACEVEYEMRRKDGTLLPVRLRGVAVRDESGAFLRSIAVIEDLTVLRALEAKMFEAQKLESLGLMAANIAHDFNNLLASLIGNAQLARRHAGQIPTAARALDHIMIGSARAADLCKQLLAYSGKGRLQNELVALDVLVREMSEVLAVSGGEETRISLDLHTSGTFIEVDETQIRQVVMNLVLNGIDALGGHPGTVTVCTSVVALDSDAIARCLQPAAKPGQYVELRVSDDGSGMRPEVLGHIFDPFFTTKMTGRGLGLAAVQGIVRGHVGTLAVTTELGAGTTFRVYLPIADLRKPALPASPSRMPSEAAPRRTIAVVDNDDLLRSALANQLSDAGYDVVTASSAAAALALARAGDVGTFLVDVSMPDVDGAEIARQLQLVAPEARVILMSGLAAAPPSTPENVGFLAKPFSELELLRSIGRAR